QQSMKNMINTNMEFAAKQYKILMQNTPDTLMPRSFDASKNQLVTSDTKWWCSGFYPGSLLYIYEYTKDPVIKTEALKRLGILEKEKYYTGNHDLGFKMFCSFGNAYRIFGDSTFKEVIFKAAASLATRYRPSIKAIQSWNSNEKLKCPVIIDNMMNLELLYWVSEHGGDARFKEIAVTHANTTLQNHFRPDYSSYHVVDYDLNTGDVIKKITWQGAADSSAWARGQAWGLYGYTMMYRFTKNKAYLDLARHIAQFILHHTNLPADKIPYWDFNAVGIPSTYRDASSASILASAFLELGQYVTKKESKELVYTAEKILQSLASPAYRSNAGENGGFILLHSVGSVPNKSEVDVPLTYADYYFLEALKRYKDWYLDK
ncbi:MAG: glucuronyl hydrolase, partial [Ferruginibacter sp.]